MIYGLRRLPQLGLIDERPARIWIAVEAREVAAGNLQPYAMALEEHVAADPGVDRYLVGLSRRGRRGLFERVAIAQPQDAVAEVARGAIRKYIHQFRREIGIRRRRRGVQH